MARPISEGELRKQLAAEGFSHTFVWQDGPQAHYPDHTHPGLTAHVILEGEMILTMDGKSRTFRAGDRCDVPAGATNSAKMRRRGCRLLVGEQSSIPAVDGPVQKFNYVQDFLAGVFNR